MPAKRGQGQWALGYREPLNPNEQAKKDSNPLTVKQRVIDIYAKQGFDSIDGADLRGRLRWYGLYTQRAEGIPGGRTAMLEPEELDARYFMLRVRIDGGQLSQQQLQVIGELSTEFGRDVADVTDRQNVQLHWIRIEDVPTIWERLEAVGLNSTEACGDTPRVIIGCPLAGVDGDEVIDASAVIRRVVDRFVGDVQFSNLPRKFKTSISGCSVHCSNHEINDIAFVGVEKDGVAGYDLWVGGGLSTNPKLGVRLGTFVEPERVEEVWAGVCSVFRDYGYRRSRMHARIKFLMADWGPEEFRRVLETEYLTAPLPDGPAPATPATPDRDHLGVHKQKGGELNYVGFVPRAGRTSGTQLQRIAALAGRHGSGRTATTAQQGMVVLDVPDDQVDALVEALELEDLRVNPSRFRRGVLACTGLEFCKLAIVETKASAVELYSELEKRLPDFDEPLTININGCPNSCARFQTADIGFKGMIVDGEEGYQVHLGGRLGEDAGFGRKARGLKITKVDTPDYVEKVLRTYLADREPGERFAVWARRADEEQLL